MGYDKKIINQVKDILVSRGETLAVAESVTSGQMQSAFSLAEDARFFFQGGLTAYNLGQKARHLRVDPINAEKVNCISQSVSNKMATEISKNFVSDYGIGITGYATLVPECAHEGLHAYYAISYLSEIISEGKLVTKQDDPLQAQIEYTTQVISIFLKLLMNNKKLN